MTTPPPDNYMIRPDYVPNTGPARQTATSGEVYWNAQRLEASALYQYAVYQWASNIAATVETPTIVDVGCGPGTKLEAIAQRHPSARLIGIDTLEAVAFCRAHHPFGRWMAMNFETDPFPDVERAADLVICADVIEHLDDPDRLLRLIRHVAKPDARVLLSTPDRNRLRGAECRACEHRWHVREWASHEFVRYLASRGLIVEDTRWQFPIRPGLSRYFLAEVLTDVRRRRHPRWNFAVLANLERGAGGEAS